MVSPEPVIVYITPKTGRFENTPPVDMVCPTCPPRVFTITPNTGTLGIEGQAPVVE